MKTALLPTLLAAAVLGCFSACDSAQPCPVCPALSGPWAVSWTDGVRPAGCQLTGPRPAMLNLVQDASSLKTIVDGKELKGTILDTWDFTLNGGDTVISYSMRGRAISDGADGGAHIEGTLVTYDNTCSIDDGYLGQRL